MTTPLFDPSDGETVSHVAASSTPIIQFTLEVMENVFCSPEGVKLRDFGETDSVGGAACVTPMVLVMPLTLTVMFAVRCDSVVLALAVAVTVPLFVPEAGVTVSHDVALLLADQPALEVMVKECCSPEDAKSNEVGETVRVADPAACDTAMVCSGTPVTSLLTVIVAVRPAVVVLALAVTDMAPLFVPADCDTVSQLEASLLTLHRSLELTVNSCCSPSAAKFRAVVVTDSVIFSFSCSIFMHPVDSIRENNNGITE